MTSYRSYKGVSTGARLEAFKNDLPKPPKAPRKRRTIPAPPLKTVVTMFGVVELPEDMDPQTLTAENFYQPHVRLIPVSELPEPLREYVEKMEKVPLPPPLKIGPTLELTAAQLNILQIIDAVGTGDLNEIYVQVQKFQTYKRDPLNRVFKALQTRGLIGEDFLVTELGKKHLDQQDEVERLRR